MDNRRKGDQRIKAIVAQEISNALAYDRTELSDARARAIDYYFGDVSSDTPARPNRSSVVSRDLSNAIMQMLPGIMRTFTASGCIVEYEPVGPEDEEMAEQASEYIHHVFMKQNEGYRVLYDALHDSLLLKQGIIKTWWDDTPEEEISTHTGLTEDQVTLLVSGDDVEVLATDERQEEIAPEEREQMFQAASAEVEQQARAVAEQQPPMVNPETGEEIPAPAPEMPEIPPPPEMRTVYDVKIRRIKRDGKICVEAIAPEDLLIQKDTVFLDRSRFVAQRQINKTRSDLIEMGYPREKVDQLGWDGNDYSDEKLAREGDSSPIDVDDAPEDSTAKVTLYECYARIDVDDDGVAELVKIDYAGDDSSGCILEWEIWEDDIPFDDIPCQPVPHRYDALSVADDVIELMRVQTVLQRQLLDNNYMHNNPQPVVREGVVINKDALLNGKFGQPIFIRRNAPDKPLEWRDTPFIGDKALMAISHIDEQISKRTGTNRHTMALDADALQNQTATAVQKQADAQYTKVEFIARNMAELGLKKVFRKMLRLVVRHQNRLESFRLRGDWQEIDPRHWNADMDCTVNIGLGSGSRDRDMAMLQVMLQNLIMLAEKMAEGGFTSKALEFLPKIREVMIKIGESAGIRNSDDYYPDFGDEELAGMAEQAAAQASQNTEAELEREKLQIQSQIDMEKMRIDAEMSRQKLQMESELRRQEMQAQMQLKREQVAEELAMRREQISAELQMQRELGLYNANINGAVKASTVSDVHPGGDPG